MRVRGAPPEGAVEEEYVGKLEAESGSSGERAVPGSALQTYSLRSEITESGLGMLALRILYFYTIGGILGGLWLILSWFACLTVIGIPLGVWMIHQVPQIMTLKKDHEWEVVRVGETSTAVVRRVEQHALPVRAVYFLAVGWWLSLVWLKIAIGAAATFILLPISFWMINRLPKVMTLHKG